LTQYTQEKTVTLPANGAQEITYELSNLPASTYEIKLSAEAQNIKALMKVRAPVGGEKGMLLYMGLDRFPIAEKDEVTVFACYATATDYSTRFPGSLRLEVLDENGDTITQDSGEVNLIPTPPQGKKTTFQASAAHKTVTLRASLYDDSNNLQDTRTLTYDYSDYAGDTGTLSISAYPETITDGSDITYKVTYKDKTEAPLKGRLFIYVTNPKGKVIETESDIGINGQYSGKFTVNGDTGDYTITARETTNDKKAETTFRIGLIEEITTTTMAGEETTHETTTTEPQPSEEKDRQTTRR